MTSIFLSLFFLGGGSVAGIKETYTCTPPISPRGGWGGASTSHHSHPSPSPATPATCSPQVCIEKAQFSRPVAAKRNLDHMYKQSPLENNFPASPLSTDTLCKIFSWLVFISVLMSPRYCTPGQLSQSLGVGVAVFSP